MIDILARVILEEQTNKRQGIHKTQKIKLLRIKERKEKNLFIKKTQHTITKDLSTTKPTFILLPISSTKVLFNTILKITVLLVHLIC